MQAVNTLLTVPSGTAVVDEWRSMSCSAIALISVFELFPDEVGLVLIAVHSTYLAPLQLQPTGTSLVVRIPSCGTVDRLTLNTLVHWIILFCTQLY
ncbi:hypothetical protein AOLI_G00029870 [Acnodon oligacanthus]